MTLNDVEAYCLSKPGAFMEMTDHSYATVLGKLPKRHRLEINGLAVNAV